jgi:hypothetical protein
MPIICKNNIGTGAVALMGTVSCWLARQRTQARIVGRDSVHWLASLDDDIRIANPVGSNDIDRGITDLLAAGARAKLACGRQSGGVDCAAQFPALSKNPGHVDHDARKEQQDDEAQSD